MDVSHDAQKENYDSDFSGASIVSDFSLDGLKSSLVDDVGADIPFDDAVPSARRTSHRLRRLSRADSANPRLAVSRVKSFPPRQRRFPLKGTAVFWLPKNATEALNAVKASIAAIQSGRFKEEFLEDEEGESDNDGKSNGKEGDGEGVDPQPKEFQDGVQST